MLPASAQLEYLVEALGGASRPCLDGVRLTPAFPMPGHDADGFNRAVDIQARRRNGRTELVEAATGYVIASAVDAANMTQSPGGYPAGKVDARECESRCPHRLHSDEIYAWYEGCGLHYGLDFRVLECLRYNAAECLGELKPSLLRHERLHTLLVDGALQAVGVVFAYDTPRSLFETRSIRRVELLVEQLNRKTKYFVHGRLVARSLDAVVADVCVCSSADGTVLVRMLGVTLVARERPPRGAANVHRALVQPLATPTVPLSQTLEKFNAMPYLEEDLRQLELYISEPGVNMALASRERLVSELRVLDGTGVIADLSISVELLRTQCDVLLDDITVCLSAKPVVTVCVVDDRDDCVIDELVRRFGAQIDARHLVIISARADHAKHPPPRSATISVCRDILDVTSPTPKSTFASGSQDFVVYAGSPSAADAVPATLGPLVNCGGGRLYFSAVVAANEFTRAVLPRTPGDHSTRDWITDLRSNGFEYAADYVDYNSLGAATVVATRAPESRHAEWRTWACLVADDGDYAAIAERFGESECARLATPASLESTARDCVLYAADARTTLDAAVADLSDVVKCASGSTVVVIVFVREAGESPAVRALRALAEAYSRGRDVYCVTTRSDRTRDAIDALRHLSPSDRCLDVGADGTVRVTRNLKLATRISGSDWVLRNNEVVKDNGIGDSPNEAAETSRGQKSAVSAVCKVSNAVTLLVGENLMAVCDQIRGEIDGRSTVVSTHCLESRVLLNSLLSHAHIWNALRPIRVGADVLFIDRKSCSRDAAVRMANELGIRLVALSNDDLVAAGGGHNSPGGMVSHSELGEDIVAMTRGEGVSCIVVNAPDEGGVASVDCDLLDYEGRVVVTGGGGVDVTGSCNGQFVRSDARTMSRRTWELCCDELMEMYEKGVLSTVPGEPQEVRYVTV